MNAFFITLLIGTVFAAATAFPAFYIDKKTIRIPCTILFILCVIAAGFSVFGVLEAVTVDEEIEKQQAYCEMVEADLVDAFDDVGHLTSDAYRYNVWLFGAKRNLERRGCFSPYYNTGVDKMQLITHQGGLQ